MFLLGLSLIGLGLDGFDLRVHWLAWHGAVLPAVYALCVSVLYHLFDRYRPIAASTDSETGSSRDVLALVAPLCIALGVVIVVVALMAKPASDDS